LSVLPKIATRIRGLLPNTPAAANADTRFVGSLPDSALWDQVRAQVAGKVRRVSVVGPYFDSGMRFLRAIDEAFSPDEIVVGIQPETAVLPILSTRRRTSASWMLRRSALSGRKRTNAVSSTARRWR